MYQYHGYKDARALDEQRCLCTAIDLVVLNDFTGGLESSDRPQKISLPDPVADKLYSYPYLWRT